MQRIAFFSIVGVVIFAFGVWFILASFIWKDIDHIVSIFYSAAAVLLCLMLIIKWRLKPAVLLVAYGILLLTWSVVLIEPTYLHTSVLETSARLLRYNIEFRGQVMVNGLIFMTCLTIIFLYRCKNDFWHEKMANIILSLLSMLGILITLHINHLIYPWTPFINLYK